MFGSLLHVSREYGIGWLYRRALYELRVRSGRLGSAHPAREWEPREWEQWLHSAEDAVPERLLGKWRRQEARHFVDPECVKTACDAISRVAGKELCASLLEKADALLAGKYPYFSKTEAELGFPPDWHVNPFTGGRVDTDLHWSRLTMFSPDYGDMKDIWEPGRFASAYLLARAYAVTRSEKYADGFWRLVESWEEQCPPNTGAHWKCGQEMSLRIMAWFFALYVLADSPVTTAERFARIIGMIAVQVDRIVDNHIYAQLQRNNHSMSEGAGIFAAGLLLPFMKKAESWKRRGLEILCREARLLIAPLGTFSQKSHNYHRLMLHDYLYAMRLGELNGVEFPEDVRKRVINAIDYLCQVLDLESGRVPNFGANDGALIMPLNGCDYTDFRPICQAGRFFVDRRRWLDPGPWDEDLFWMFGPNALDAGRTEFEQEDIKRTDGGAYTIRSDNSWLFTHCESYRERPSQADCLHVDLWWKGLNIACDAGTYRYYAEPPWNNGLRGTGVHNTACVDGKDQMEPGSRFLWTRWHRARVLRMESYPEEGIALWEGEHDGYSRLTRPVSHRRTVVNVDGSTWLIVDTLGGKGTHDFRLHWLLSDCEHEKLSENADLTFHTEKGDYHLSARAFFSGSAAVEDSLVRASEDGVRGWSSAYYGQREPALSFALDVDGGLPGRFLTIFSDNPVGVDCSSGTCFIQAGPTALELQAADQGKSLCGGALSLIVGKRRFDLG